MTTTTFDPRAILERHHEAMVLWNSHRKAARSRYYYESLFDFVLKEGQTFTNITKAKRLGPKKMCFKNAWMMAWDDPDLTYVEGYYINPNFGLPIAHAWVVDPEGTVIETTLRWSGKYGEPRTGHGYIGVPFATDFVAERLVEQGTYTLIDNWQAGWPLMKEKLPERAKRKVPATS